MRRYSPFPRLGTRPLWFAADGGPPPIIEPQSIRTRPPPAEPGPPKTPFWHWMVFALILVALALGAWFLWATVRSTLDAVSEPPSAPLVEESKRAVPARADSVEGRGGTPRLPTESAEPVPVEEGTRAVPARTDSVEERGKMPRLLEEPGIDPSVLREQRNRAETAFEQFVGKKQDLVDLGVDEWGGTLYERVLADSVEADGYLLAENYPAATEAYERAIAGCEQLEMQTFEALDRMLAEGEAAFAATNGALAVRKLEAALKLDPTDKTAATLLPRARTLDQVTALLKSGREREQRRQWGLALTDYQEAVELDELSSEAVTARDRVLKGMQDQQFQQRMSEGLRALQDEDLDEAERILKEAEAIKPGTAEVKNALFQVKEARRLVRIRMLQQQAQEAEATEDWQQAYLRYKDILTIDPHIEAAVTGQERNAARIRLARQMNFYLGHPEHLLNQEGRKNATEILQEAGELPAGPVAWDQAIVDLTSALAAASTPIEVVLTSDGQTSVDIYKVDRFQPFTHKTVSLLPGAYTVVGHRRGFKDQRHTLNVVPGDSGETQLSVVCDQPIR